MAGEFSVTIEGLEHAKRQFSELGPKAQRAVFRNAEKKAAKIVVDDAKQRVPVGPTGDLKGGIRSRAKATLQEIRVDIGFEKEEFYGMFVELGTSKMSARPFLRPALDTNTQRIVETMAEALNEEIAKAAIRG